MTKSTGRRVAVGLAGAGVLLAFLVWWMWEQSPERRAQRIDAEIAALEQTLRTDRADLMRERADCIASAVEIGEPGGDYVRACMEAVQLQAQMLIASQSRIREAIAALRRKRAGLR